MSKLSSIAVALCALFAALSPAAASTPMFISVDFTLAPSDKAPNAFVARAVVRDAATEEVISAPALGFVRGSEATASTKLPTGAELRVTVLVPESSNEARYTVELVEGEKVTVLQKSSIKLGA